MGFKIDTEVVKDSVATLRQLLEECEELYGKEIPDSSVDRGLTHNELHELCQNIKMTCQYLGELINNSIRFLGESSDMFDTSDKESATAVFCGTFKNPDRFQSSDSKQILNKAIGNVAFFREGIKDSLNDYFDIIKSEGDIRSKSAGVIKWLSSIGGNSGTIKDYIEYISGDEFKWPSPIKDGFDFIKALDTSNKLIFGFADYGHGLANGDTSSMIEGADGLLSAMKSGISSVLKTENTMIDFKSGLLLDYGKNMVSNWIESIQKETKVSEVYWNTFANSAIEVFGDTVCNAPTLAIAYKPAEIISSAVGFDLQGAYENISDKKGFAAVTDTFSQMKDVFMENASWENWKSGMGVIVDKLSHLF